ncbi:MAG: S41 family peptidase [Bacteroidales bacterium]|nr:S41 family peptidase [Bacteroidales bacterium]
MKAGRIILSLALCAALLSSCDKDKGYTYQKKDPSDNTEQQKVQTEQAKQRSYVNDFAYVYMSQLYLWADEIKSGLAAWKNAYTTKPENVDPVAKVDELKHSYDRWSFLTDDFASFTSEVAGVSTTFGYDLKFYYYDSSKNTVCAVILYVYADSPAAKAGLERGDAIVKVNNKQMTTSNYVDIYNSYLSGGSPCDFEVQKHGHSQLTKISMSPVEMYENPVLMHKVFDVAGKKVGYLAYTSFTLDSIEDLKAVASDFKSQGVTELILDLRYNGGGYVITEMALAAMLAPEGIIGDASGKGGEVYEKSVYNSSQMKGLSDEDITDYFTQVMSDGNGGYYYNTVGCNMNLKKIYAIMTSGTASASESVIVGLKPYMDIQIIGEPKSEGSVFCSHGKFCTGGMYGAEDFVKHNEESYGTKYAEALKYVRNWGLYMMFARYTDKNGDCPVMPEGFQWNVKSVDTPDDGIQLGDENEVMLKSALACAAGNEGTKAAEPLSEGLMQPLERQIEKPSFGLRISHRGLPVLKDRGFIAE